MDYRGMMVGDWLLDKEEGLSRRVAQVTSDVFEGCAPGVILENGMDYQECEPIPLTPEILEKNGWKEAQFCHEYKDGKNTIQACLPDMRGIINGVEIQHFQCEYVHQYQHLLRLCGLNDLADNFKVE